MTLRPNVVLLHAFPLDHRMWDEQVVALRRHGWSVEAWDLPGFGGTSLPPGAPDLDVVADVLIERLRRLDRGPVVLGGLSLGGYCVMAIARRSPEVIAGMLLCDTKAVADTAAARSGRLAMADAVSHDPDSVSEALRTSVLPNLVGRTTHERRPSVLARVDAWLDSADPTSVAWYQRAMAARPDAHADLAALSVPSLVLWGDEDALSPAADQLRMLDVLSSATSVRIPACGHLSALECPQDVSDSLVAFMDDAWGVGAPQVDVTGLPPSG